jgi:hypothetical protein
MSSLTLVVVTLRVEAILVLPDCSFKLRAIVPLLLLARRTLVARAAPQVWVGAAGVFNALATALEATWNAALGAGAVGTPVLRLALSPLPARAALADMQHKVEEVVVVAVLHRHTTLSFRVAKHLKLRFGGRRASNDRLENKAQDIGDTLRLRLQTQVMKSS